jgi:hypothetical protein
MSDIDWQMLAEHVPPGTRVSSVKGEVFAAYSCPIPMRILSTSPTISQVKFTRVNFCLVWLSNRLILWRKLHFMIPKTWSI